MQVRNARSGDRLGDGRAVELRGKHVTAETVRAAVRGESETVVIDCQSPSRWLAPLGYPENGAPALDRVIAAARSQGHHPPHERALGTAQRELQRLAVDQIDTAEARQRLADAGTAVDRIREEVATARGRLQARREMGADTADAESALTAAMKRLSEAETERIAAEQAHQTAERQARQARKLRERRLKLQDRVANRRRETRHALAAHVAEAFTEAVSSLPGDATLSTAPLGVNGDDVTAALAAVRIADLRAPIVDTTSRFASASATAAALDTPVIRT